MGRIFSAVVSRDRVVVAILLPGKALIFAPNGLRLRRFVLNTGHRLFPEHFTTTTVTRGQTQHATVGGAERILFGGCHQALLLKLDESLAIGLDFTFVRVARMCAFMIKNEISHVRITDQHCFEHHIVKVDHRPTFSVQSDNSRRTAQLRMTVTDVAEAQPDFLDFATFAVAFDFTPRHYAIRALERRGGWGRNHP